MRLPKLFTPHRLCLAVVAAFGAPASGLAQSVLAGWNTSGLAGGAGSFGPSPFSASTIGAHINSTPIIERGAGVVTSGAGAARGWGGADWTSGSVASGVTNGDFFTAKIQGAPGFSVSLSSISTFDYRRTASGPDSGMLQYSIDGTTFTNVQALTYAVVNAGSLASVSLAGVSDLQNVDSARTITLRIVNLNGQATGGWYIYDTANSSADDFAVSGTTAPVPEPGTVFVFAAGLMSAAGVVRRKRAAASGS